MKFRAITALHLRPHRLARIFRIQLCKLPQNLLRPLVLNLGHHNLNRNNLVAALSFCAAEGTPRSRIRSFCPLCVPCGIFNCVRPSIVGTSIFDPKRRLGHGRRNRYVNIVALPREYRIAFPRE